jgi:hypothetical protein
MARRAKSSRRLRAADRKLSGAVMAPLLLIAIAWALIAKFCGD